MYKSISSFYKQYHLQRIGIGALVLLSLGLCFTTYCAFSKSAPIAINHKYTIALLYFDLSALLLLSFIVAQRLVKQRSHSKSSGAGSRIHTRLVRWFGLLLVTPAIIIAIFSAIFFNLGIESWFSKRVHTALKHSTEVAEAYLQEHKKVISSDVKFIAKDLASELPMLISSPKTFNQYINRQTEQRSLTEAMVFTKELHVLARSELSFNLMYQTISENDIKQADNEVVILQSESKDRVRALIKIDPTNNIYLMVGRLVDPQVLSHIYSTETAVSEYHQLESLRSDYEINFILIFAILTLLLLLTVIWIGLAFANRLARPIGKLIDAADRVRSGDLSARVDVQKDGDELNLLNQAFNRMTAQLELQTKELIDANQQIEQRRQFIEAVSDGVSAGVIGLDQSYNITWANQSAANLLATNTEDLQNKKLSLIVPEMDDLLKQAKKQKTQSQISIIRSGCKQILSVQTVALGHKKNIAGYVVTFDDITELLSAQRNAAWSDVARRIAHEIKNPLTPIQLSAERLKSRYVKQITQESGNFQKYIDTIIRQVSYIGEMVSEFSAFARMPAPQLQIENLAEICDQSLLLQRAAHSSIDFELKCKSKTVDFNCDLSQIGRVITNLLQNAIDSIDSRSKTDSKLSGKIIIEITTQPDQIILTIDDNGKGFPKEGREQLTEPYITQREKGTGLGLAIVKRIIEDHGASLSLDDNPKGIGARITLHFTQQHSITKLAS